MGRWSTSSEGWRRQGLLARLPRLGLELAQAARCKVARVRLKKTFHMLWYIAREMTGWECSCMNVSEKFNLAWKWRQY